jgi:hypothetical protein
LSFSLSSRIGEEFTSSTIEPTNGGERQASELQNRADRIDDEFLDTPD